MNTLSLKTIQDRYGYELSQISRWQDEGLDLTWPENQINNWIVTNKINP